MQDIGLTTWSTPQLYGSIFRNEFFFQSLGDNSSSRAELGFIGWVMKQSRVTTLLALPFVVGDSLPLVMYSQRCSCFRTLRRCSGWGRSDFFTKQNRNYSKCLLCAKVHTGILNLSNITHKGIFFFILILHNVPSPHQEWSLSVEALLCQQVFKFLYMASTLKRLQNTKGSLTLYLLY